MINIKRFTRAVEYGVIGSILWSIKNNGLEKTLEDLHKNCHIYGPPPTQEIYESVLRSLKQMDDSLYINTGGIDG